MPTVKEKLAIEWQQPTTEAHWRRAAAPAEAPALAAAVRAALDDMAAQREIRVILRQDGTRWRVQAEYGDAHGQAAYADLRSALDLTRKTVEALRKAGFHAEPGFSGDPNEPSLPVGPTE